MNLKRLEISGFKSFRDRVVLDFSSGTTGIVGPNGCGKSNIVDAIRWVMGEQRVKALRGKKMDDVVFNGSQDSAPVSMAEITMTLVANGNNFPGAYADLNEISISRRVVLEGESEYYINKAPCRLLDIKEFFMGTGVGARTYSLVEQGHVANLVEAKPEDRRLFIEDAAGVSKYKSRKEAAVRKMEATKQNMVRLNDILKEVKSQLNAISRQAKRAEQYKNIKQESKETELTIALQSYVELAEKELSLQAERADLQSQDAVIHANIEAKESAIDELKVKLLENEELIAKSQHELYEIKNTISIKEKSIEFARVQIIDTTERKQKDMAEIQMLQTRKDDLTAEIDNLQKNAAEAESKIAALKTEHEEGRQKVEQLINANKEVINQLEEKKILYIDIVTEKAKFKNMVSSLSKNIEDLIKREERETRELDEDKKMFADLAGKLSLVIEELKQDEAQIVKLEERKAAASAELERSKSDLQLNEEDVAKIREDTSVKSSRLVSLKEFQDAYKWCNEGVKTIIEDKEHSDKFYGVVADHISVPREYEAAVEAVLGEKLQYVVVKSQEDGVHAIDHLKNYQLGRGSFVSVDLRNHNAKTYSDEHLNEAELLLEKVKVHEDYKQIIDCLLGDVLLIPTIENGISLWKKNGFKGTFVTPDGDIISPHGVLTGGSGSAVEKSLLATKREIGELEIDVAALAADLEVKTNQKNNLVSTIARWEEDLSQAKTDIHSLEIAINGRKKDHERFEAETNRLKQRITVLEFNRQNLNAEKTEAEEKSKKFNADILLKDEEEKQINEVISVFNRQREQSRAEIDQQERYLTGKKIEMASLEEKKEADLRTVSRLQNDISSIAGENESKSEEIVSCEKQIVELTQTIENEQALLKDLYQGFAAQEALLAEKKAGQNREDAELKTKENEIREVKKTLDELRRQINEMEMQCREVALNSENLKKVIAEKHDVDLAVMAQGFEKIEEEKLAGLIALLEKNKQIIDDFGEVNLLALNEYEELDKRYSFLSTQVADLSSSLNVLQRTITRINKISRARFAETFEAVNACFKEVFTQIFPGGRGELLLTDENDLLETGVDIDIQVPGKRRQNVNLLSGGEKSLVAVALIFAILKYRPSPFLILDEVDAALDDANTNLFNRLIKDVANHSQVVMITHNKSTMEVADTLFGVTMQKQGISTLVSVNLN
ncbi:MAG: chromosome segregation protein SMC [Deltaproteobacteria bacterium HGW-Deltaproteobacteria-13]|jgi:chromosome segregation protein|nr:MAG: chromosome segregation protein SMC [Deltaproteobacteria bacterium HGW-Deltaproteobacteria-13]